MVEELRVDMNGVEGIDSAKGQWLPGVDVCGIYTQKKRWSKAEFLCDCDAFHLHDVVRFV